MLCSSNGPWGSDMTTRNRIAAAAISAAIISSGCAGATAQGPPPIMQRGASLWAATCHRCHNLRPPQQYSAGQWPVIVTHMRTRADLTKSEAEAIAAYLQQVASGQP